MKTKLLFDPLDYAKILKNGGVENADIHASSLSQILASNLYTKDEIDMRFEQALNRFDASMQQMERRFERLFNDYRISQEKQLGEIRGEIHQLELRFEKKINHYLITTISVLGSLIVVVGAISTFAHTLFH